MTPATAIATLQRASQNVTVEHTGLELAIVKGAVPPELDGCLFRNGPGRLERGGHRYGHLFDGDGHITRFEIGRGRIKYTNRFVRTPWFNNEERTGRLLYRGFGTNRPGGLWSNLFRMRFKNAANTSVVWHGGRLLALWEGGLPYELDPTTLETRGPCDFDGWLRTAGGLDRMLSPVLPFSAHPTIDHTTGELWNFGMSIGVQSRLVRYRVDRHGRMSRPIFFKLDRLSFVHDAILTPRHQVFLLPHADFDVPSALLGRKTPAGSISVDTDRRMSALVFSRTNDAAPIRLETETGFVFHFAQAFERGEEIVIDAVRFERYPPLDSIESLFERPDPRCLPRLVRIVINPQRGTSVSTAWGDRAAELPSTGPIGSTGADAIYSVGAPGDWDVPYLSSIQRLDTQSGTWRVRDLYPDLPGEPLVVSDASGKPQWVVSLVYGAKTHRSRLVILDADTLETVAEAALPHHVPPGFHGCFVPS